MRTDERVRNIIKEEKFIPNKLMQLGATLSTIDTTKIELDNKRGYTLKTLPSNIREVYEKQSAIRILNEKR